MNPGALSSPSLLSRLQQIITSVSPSLRWGRWGQGEQIYRAGKQRWERPVTPWVSRPEQESEALTAVIWTCSSPWCFRALQCVRSQKFTHLFSLFNLCCIFFLCFSSKRSRSMLRRWRRCSRLWCSCRQRVRSGNSWNTGCGPAWRENWNLSGCSRYPLFPCAVRGFL